MIENKIITIVEDSYDTHGYYTNSLCIISEDFNLINIRRISDKNIYTSNIFNVYGSNEVCDWDYYMIPKEYKLCGYSRSIEEKEVRLVLSKENEELKDKIVNKLKEQGEKLEIKVKIIDTFNTEKEEIEEQISQFGLKLKEDWTICFPTSTEIETKIKDVLKNSEEDVKEDEIPF